MEQFAPGKGSWGHQDVVGEDKPGHTLDTPLSGEGALYITNPHIDQPPLQSTLLSRRQTIDDWEVKEPCIWLSAGLNPDKKVNLVGESNPCYEPPHCNALTSHLV